MADDNEGFESSPATDEPSKPKKTPPPKLSVDQARELMRAHVAAFLREKGVREIIGLEEYEKFCRGKTAMARLLAARDWVAREVENLA